MNDNGQEPWWGLGAVVIFCFICAVIFTYLVFSALNRIGN